MAASLGAFSVDVLANIGQFESDLGRANRVAQREAEKIKRVFVNAAAAIGVGFSASAFTGWIKGAIDAQDQAVKMAQKIGIATESVAGLTFAAEQAGVEQQNFQSAMVRLARSASDASQGLKTQKQAFDAVGVSVLDAGGHLKGTEVLLGEVSDKLGAVEDSAQKTAIATQLFGKAGAEIIPLLNGGSAALAEYIQMAEDFGLTVGTQAAKNAERFNDALDQLSKVSKGVANQIATALVPTLADLTESAVRFFRSDQWKRVLADISAGARAFADNLERIIGAAKLAGSILGVLFAGKVANALALATFRVVALTAQTYNAATSATVLGKAWIAAGGNIMATTAASIKQIGLMPGIIGVVTAAFSGWKIGEYLREQFMEARLAGIAFVDGTLTGWEVIKGTAKVAWEVIKHYFDVFVEGALTGLSLIVKGLSFAAFGQGNGALSSFLSQVSDGIDKAIKPAGDLSKAIEGVVSASARNVAAIHKSTGEMADFEIRTQIAGDAAKKLAEQLNTISYANLRAVKGTQEYATAVDQINRAASTAIAMGVKQADAHKMAAEAVLLLGSANRQLAPSIGEVSTQSEKLAEHLATGQQKLTDLANSFIDFQDPLAAAMDKFRDQIVTVGRAAEEQQKYIDALRESGGGANMAAADSAEAAMQQAVADATNNAIAARNASIAAIERERDVTARYVADLGDEAKLIGLNAKQQRAEILVLRALAEAKKMNAAAGKEVAKVDADRIRQEALLSDKLRDVNNLVAQFGQKSPFEQLADDIANVGEQLDKAFGKKSQDQIEALARTVGELRQQQLLYATDAIGQGIESLKSMASEGSRAYKALQIAQDANNLAAAIGAIVNQGMGDPYTAFARMAAMAAAVSKLVGSIGSFGGDFANTAAKRQETQGTGTVLGDMSAKSESIANAVEITANATTELVGINRGMLNALMSLQEGLGSASNLLARGAGQADFSGMNLAVASQNPLGIPISESILDPFGWLGGSSKVTDEGIVIFAGALNDMLNGIALGAYQEVQSRSWVFGSTHTNTGIMDVSDEFAQQFQLIVGSITDAVRSGAEALGLLPDQIQAALDTFRTEEIRISLMDLSAEEQQAELTAVFSQLFDGLAAQVVPFVEQFQQVGEGLGETLIRVATGVQVTQEAMRQLGLVIEETDPERFAQISEGLIGAIGGIDAFISGMQSFVSNFAPDAHKLAVATAAIGSAFEQVGLTVPATADGFWELMQSLDGTTEQGQEQIATLLRLSDVAAQYYQLVKKAEEDRLKYITQASDLLVELGQSGGFIAARAQIEAWAASTAESLNDLARSAGMAGASASDLANVQLVAAQRIAQVVAKLKQAAADLAVQLGYISGTDTLESLNAQIDAFGSAALGASDAIGAAVDSMREKMNLLLGDLSPFNDQKKLELALEGLRAGTVDASTVLEIGRRLYASTSNYTDLFNQVMGMANFGQASNTGNGGAPSATGDGRTLQELIAARDALLAAQRPELADQLAHRIAELALATGNDFAEVASSIGFDLGQIAQDLGLSNEDLHALLEQYLDQFNTASFADVGAMIEAAINSSTDRIVSAITGEPMSAIEAADQRVQAIADNEAAARAESDQRVIAELQSLKSALLVSDERSADRVVASQVETRRDLREFVNGLAADRGRNGIAERIR